MRIFSLLLLFVFFAFSIGLVLLNTNAVQVNLLFAHVPAMPLGLLLLLTLFLGVVVGLLLGVQVFKVFQNRWEISRLKKELDVVRNKHLKAVEAAATSKTAEQQALNSVESTPNLPSV